MRKLLAFMLAVAFLIRCTEPVVLLSPESEELTALRKQLLAAALEWAKPPSFYSGPELPPDRYPLMMAVRDARLALAKSKKQRIEALESYLRFAEQWRRIVRALYEAGARGGEADEYQRRLFLQIDAKIAILETEQQDSPR